MNIEEIRNKYNNGDYTYKVELPEKVNESHVFDENLSVKQNREMVIEYNANVSKIRQDYIRKNTELFAEMRTDVIEYIMCEYGFAENVSKIIESHVYIEEHSCMSDYFSSIDTYCEFVCDIILCIQGGTNI